MMELQIGDTTLLFKPDPQPDSPDRAVCVAFVAPDGGDWVWEAAGGSFGAAGSLFIALNDARLAVA